MSLLESPRSRSPACATSSPPSHLEPPLLLPPHFDSDRGGGLLSMPDVGQHTLDICSCAPQPLTPPRCSRSWPEADGNSLSPQASSGSSEAHQWNQGAASVHSQPYDDDLRHPHLHAACQYAQLHSPVYTPTTCDVAAQQAADAMPDLQHQDNADHAQLTPPQQQTGHTRSHNPQWKVVTAQTRKSPHLECELLVHAVPQVSHDTRIKIGKLTLQLDRPVPGLDLQLWVATKDKGKTPGGKESWSILHQLEQQLVQNDQVLCTVQLVSLSCSRFKNQCLLGQLHAPNPDQPNPATTKSPYERLVVHPVQRELSAESLNHVLTVRCWLEGAWAPPQNATAVASATLTLQGYSPNQIQSEPAGTVAGRIAALPAAAPQKPVNAAAAAAAAAAAPCASKRLKRPSDSEEAAMLAVDVGAFAPAPQTLMATVVLAHADACAGAAASSSGALAPQPHPFTRASVPPAFPSTLVARVRGLWADGNPKVALWQWINAYVGAVHDLSDSDVRVPGLLCGARWQAGLPDSIFINAFADLLAHDWESMPSDGRAPDWESMPSIRVETWCARAATTLGLPDTCQSRMRRLLQLIYCPEGFSDRVGWLPIYRFYCWLQPVGLQDKLSAVHVLDWALEYFFTGSGQLVPVDLAHIRLWWTRRHTAAWLGRNVPQRQAGPEWILRFSEGNPLHRVEGQSADEATGVCRQLVLVYYADCGLCEQLIMLLDSSATQPVHVRNNCQLGALAGLSLGEVLDTFGVHRAAEVHTHARCAIVKLTSDFARTAITPASAATYRRVGRQ